MTTKTKTKTAPTTGCWADVHEVLAAGIDRLLLFGPPGTGKTYAGMHLGLSHSGLAHRLQCTEDMTRAEIEGHMIPVGDEWLYNLGPVVEALGNDETPGSRIVVDEIDRVCGDAESMLMGLLDSNESIYWKHPITKATHRPQAGYSAVATTNVENMEDLPQALKDRFPIAIRIDRPHPAALERLSPDLRKAAELSADAKGDRRFSIRTFMAFDHLRNHMDTDKAARLAFGERQYRNILDAIKVEAL